MRVTTNEFDGIKNLIRTISLKRLKISCVLKILELFLIFLLAFEIIKLDILSRPLQDQPNRIIIFILFDLLMIGMIVTLFLSSFYQLIRKNILFGAYINQKQTDLGKNFKRDLIVYMFVFHILVTLLYIILLPILPINITIIVFLAFIMLILMILERLNFKKNILQTVTTQCVHCFVDIPEQQVGKIENVIDGHCTICSRTEDVIAFANVKYLIIAPLMINGLLNCLFILQGFISTVPSNDGMITLVGKLLFYPVTGIMLVLLVVNYIVYPGIVIKRFQKLDNNQNFVYINNTKPSPRNKQTVRQNQFFHFGLMYFLMLVPFLGILFIIGVVIVNLYIDMFQTMPLKEFFGTKPDYHKCHLKIEKLYIEM